MGKTWGRMALAVLVVVLMTAAQAQRVNLRPYLQAELNEIALLTAQSNYLQQQGDTLGATLVASYIPDHQMMVNTLSASMQQMGARDIPTVAVASTPFLGSRADILAYDLQQHAMVARDYQRLASTPFLSRTGIRVAKMGQSGAERHFQSLTVAQGATLGTPVAMTNGLLASLALERWAAFNLQVQADALRGMGDVATANLLTAQIPAHQQQANRIAALVTQWGADPRMTYVAPSVALTSREAIMASLRTTDIIAANTYAQQIALLPPSPIRTASIQGQNGAITEIATLFGTTAVASVPAPAQ
jgi:hypothetical protein